MLPDFNLMVLPVFWGAVLKFDRLIIYNLFFKVIVFPHLSKKILPMLKSQKYSMISLKARWLSLFQVGLAAFSNELVYSVWEQGYQRCYVREGQFNRNLHGHWSTTWLSVFKIWKTHRTVKSLGEYVLLQYLAYQEK